MNRFEVLVFALLDHPAQHQQLRLHHHSRKPQHQLRQVERRSRWGFAQAPRGWAGVPGAYMAGWAFLHPVPSLLGCRRLPGPDTKRHLPDALQTSAPPKGTPLSRLKAAESILAAAEHWKKRCLLGEKSLFTEQFLWIRENFAELRRLYVDRPSDDREKLFLWKLEPQLGPDSRQVACLWAEMDWLYSLIVTRSAVGPDNKRKRIRDIWQWSGQDFPEKHELLTDGVLGAGVVRPGRAFHNLAWMEYRFFGVAMHHWFSQDLGRSGLLSEPWEFASWLDATEFAGDRVFRHTLLFLLLSRRIRTDRLKQRQEKDRNKTAPRRSLRDC